MSDQHPEFTVQKFRGGFAIVWWELDAEGAPKRRRKPLAAQDRPSAEAEARQRWQAGDSAPWTVARVMQGYLNSIADKPSHQRRSDAWKAMRPFWENVDPEMIDEAMCQKYRSTRAVGEATARYELMQLSTALRWGRGQRHITASPTIWLPEQPERQLRHLEYDEFMRFFAAVKAEHAKLYVMLGLYTMARPSAILELTWDRVDFMRAQINFTPPGHRQTKKRRTIVPIADELLPWLQRAYAARTSQYVVEHGGDKVQSIKKAFQAASERSNVRATPYTLRHTGAVWAAEAGIPMSQLAQFMGHDDSRTTEKHYARYSPEFLRSVANAITLKRKGSR